MVASVAMAQNDPYGGIGYQGPPGLQSPHQQFQPQPQYRPQPYTPAPSYGKNPAEIAQRCTEIRARAQERINANFAKAGEEAARLREAVHRAGTNVQEIIKAQERYTEATGKLWKENNEINIKATQECAQLQQGR